MDANHIDQVLAPPAPASDPFQWTGMNAGPPMRRPIALEPNVPAEPERHDPRIGASQPDASTWEWQQPYAGPPEAGQPRAGSAAGHERLDSRGAKPRVWRMSRRPAELLLGLSAGPRVLRVHVDAVRASVHLRGAHLHELEQLRVESAGVRV